LPDSGKTEEAVEYVKERFGVDIEEMEGLKFREVSGDIWLASEDKKSLEAETQGIRAVRVMDIGLKPTTYFLQLLDDELSRNVVEVTQEEFEALLGGDMIERFMDEKGYVAVSFEGKVFGCGFYMDELVSSRIPEGRAKELLGTL
jgi:NOL1/NOP2/fmu family ribosome biogenesis protein